MYKKKVMNFRYILSNIVDQQNSAGNLLKEQGECHKQTNVV